ncbi:MAG: guanylate kinase [Desulfobacterales bacterium]|jgi:guanylate kinase
MAQERQSSAPKGRLFILSAPSGAGKSTLCRILRERLPALRYSISATTRTPRKGERQGVDYVFTDVAAFEAGIQAHRWAEWAKVHGHYYGTPAEFVDRERAAGHDVLLDIDVQGAAQLRAAYPDAVTIFIMPPSLAVLRERLEQRGADPGEVIDRRMANAEKEMAQRGAYRFTVVNDRLEAAADALVSIVRDHQQDASLGSTAPTGAREESQ